MYINLCIWIYYHVVGSSSKTSSQKGILSTEHGICCATSIRAWYSFWDSCRTLRTYSNICAVAAESEPSVGKWCGWRWHCSSSGRHSRTFICCSRWRSAAVRQQSDSSQAALWQWYSPHVYQAWKAEAGLQIACSKQVTSTWTKTTSWILGHFCQNLNNNEIVWRYGNVCNYIVKYTI